MFYLVPHGVLAAEQLLFRCIGHAFIQELHCCRYCKVHRAVREGDKAADIDLATPFSSQEALDSSQSALVSLTVLQHAGIRILHCMNGNAGTTPILPASLCVRHRRTLLLCL